MNMASRLELLDQRRRTDPTLADVLDAIEKLHSELRLGLERRRGGAPSGYGLARQTIIEAAIAGRAPDGSWPKQAAVAEALGYSVERVKQVQGPRGWAGILADAQALLNR